MFSRVNQIHRRSKFDQEVFHHSLAITISSFLFIAGTTLDVVTTSLFISHPHVYEMNPRVALAIELFGTLPGVLIAKAIAILLFFSFTYVGVLLVFGLYDAPSGSLKHLDRDDYTSSLKTTVVLLMVTSGVTWLGAGLWNIHVILSVV